MSIWFVREEYVAIGVFIINVETLVPQKSKNLSDYKNRALNSTYLAKEDRHLTWRWEIKNIKYVKLSKHQAKERQALIDSPKTAPEKGHSRYKIALIAIEGWGNQPHTIPRSKFNKNMIYMWNTVLEMAIF